jgi:hypothetical protein
MYRTWEERIRARVAAESASRKSSTRELEGESESEEEGEDVGMHVDGPEPSASAVVTRKRVVVKVISSGSISGCVLTR